MTAQRIDGKAVSDSLRNALKQRAQQLIAKGRPPGLAVILVGDDPASAVYVRGKIAACEHVGIVSIEERYAASLSQAELLARVAALNERADVHGILVQMPLPKHIDPNAVIQAIDPKKDVDGFSIQSAGALATGAPGFRSCTPYGVMKLLDSINTPLKGAQAVVVGRSNTVGKPMAMLLLERSATVTICHSASRDLASITRQADVLVAAVGRAKMITGDMVKPGAVVIDVGMNRDEAGKLCGDVDAESVAPVAGWLTPVPGGVGPMTITMLLSNTLDAAEAAAAR